MTQSFHEDYGRDEEVKGSSDRGFGQVFAAVFAVVGLWPLTGEGGSVRWWSIGLAVVFLAVAYLRPSLLAPLNWVWTRFGLLLHRVVNPIVMGLLFYCTVTPMGLIVRALGKDLLKLKRDPEADSYWIEREPPGPAPDTMSNQF